MKLVIIQQPGNVRALREYFVYLTGRKRWPDLRNDLLLGQTWAGEMNGRYYLNAVYCQELKSETFAQLLSNEAGREEAARRLHAKALEIANGFRLRCVVDGSGAVPGVSDMTLFGSDP